MKRVKLCIFIIAMIISMSVYTLYTLGKRNIQLYEYLDRIKSIYLADKNDPRIEPMIAELGSYWRDYYVNISFLIQSSQLGDISDSVARLYPLWQSDCDEFLSEIESIRYQTALLYDNEFPNLHSII